MVLLKYHCLLFAAKDCYLLLCPMDNQWIYHLKNLKSQRLTDHTFNGLKQVILHKRWRDFITWNHPEISQIHKQIIDPLGLSNKAEINAANWLAHLTLAAVKYQYGSLHLGSDSSRVKNYEVNYERICEINKKLKDLNTLFSRNADLLNYVCFLHECQDVLFSSKYEPSKKRKTLRLHERFDADNFVVGPKYFVGTHLDYKTKINEDDFQATVDSFRNRLANLEDLTSPPIFEEINFMEPFVLADIKGHFIDNL
jgi:hypothetical protein